MTNGWSVRQWVSGDTAQVGEVHSRSRQAAYAGLVPGEALARVTPEQQTTAWEARLAELPAQHAALVVEHKGAVVGFAMAQLDPEQGPVLNAIHVVPRWQGSGAGQALMDAVIDAFQTWQVPEAHLHVIQGNERAQAFYRRNGWHLQGSAGSHDVGGVVVPILQYRRTIDTRGHAIDR